MSYEDVVKMIRESEARVDEVLKAARLERHEKQPMSKEMLAMILNYIVGTLAMIMIWTCVSDCLAHGKLRRYGNGQIIEA